MSALSKAWQSAGPSQPPRGSDDCEWVSDLLHNVADADEIRRVIMSTLTVADLWCIWHATSEGTEPRDKRSHHSARAELERRGLLDASGRPVTARNDGVIDGECPDFT
jgi:hypothetical protein